MIVYKAISPSNKIYIGITTCSLEKRMKEHYKTAKMCRDNYKFYNAIRKYQFENFKWEIIDQVNSMQELFEKEEYYIKIFDSFNNGYNSTLGGEGCKGVVHSEESKRILSEKSSIQWNNLSYEEKQKRIKNNLTGHKKMVIDNFGNIFEYMMDAAIYYNIQISTVSMLIKLKKPSEKGICFKLYKNGDIKCEIYKSPIRKKRKIASEKTKENYSIHNGHNKKLIDQNGNEYRSISYASRILDLDRSTIYNHLNNSKPLINGLELKYAI